MSQIDVIEGANRSLTSRVCAQIRDDILMSRFRPGEKLKVTTLMQRYAAGLSPVREALSRLVAEGFVRVEDQRGFFVSRLSLGDLQDITAARLHIEVYAFRRSVERGGLAWEAKILSEHQALLALPKSEFIDDKFVHSDSWSKQHNSFHTSLLAECGSTWLLHFRQTLFDQWERYRRLSIARPTKPRDVDAEHEALLKAALDRNVEKATALLASHIESTALVLLQSDWPGGFLHA